jgi:hypothetical protein
MNDLPKLVDAICEAFSYGLPGQKWEPKNNMTFCNEAVSFVCDRMGYRKLEGLVANDIFDVLQTNGDWQDVTAEAASFHSNHGALVLAAWKNPDENLHGHVCVVRPGVAERSDSWGDMAPKVINIGEQNFIDKKASFAFSKGKKPQFFALKSMI